MTDQELREFAAEHFTEMKELRATQRETAEQLNRTERIVNQVTEQMRQTDERMKQTDEQMKKTDEDGSSAISATEEERRRRTSSSAISKANLGWAVSCSTK